MQSRGSPGALQCRFRHPVGLFGTGTWPGSPGRCIHGWRKSFIELVHPDVANNWTLRSTHHLWHEFPTISLYGKDQKGSVKSRLQSTALHAFTLRLSGHYTIYTDWFGDTISLFPDAVRVLRHYSVDYKPRNKMASQRFDSCLFANRVFLFNQSLSSAYLFAIAVSICQILPFTYFTYCLTAFFMTLVPMQGRSGTTSNPELVVSLATWLFTVLFGGFIVSTLIRLTIWIGIVPNLTVF